MTDVPKPDKNKPKRKLLKRFGIALLLLALVCVVFHKPLLMGLVRFSVKRGAASQHLQMDFKVSGDPLSDLTFTDIHIIPAGRTPIESGAIERAHVIYSLSGLLKHGAHGFLKNCEIRNANLVFKDIPGPPGEQSHLGNDMHDWFFQPIPLIGGADVENLNILSHTPVGDFTLKGGYVWLSRGKPGWLRIESMQIPGVKKLENIEGRATISESSVGLESVKLAPDIIIDQAISTPNSKKGGVSNLTLEGKIFGGTISGTFEDTLQYGRTFDTRIKATITDLGVDALRNFLESPIPFNGKIDFIDAQWNGNADRPAYWQGQAQTFIKSQAGIGKFKIEQGDAKLVFEDHKVRLETTEFSGGNKGSIQAAGKLPDKLNEFRAMALDGRFQLSAPDLSRTFAKLTHGSAVADGNFSLRDKVFSSQIVATGKEINSDKCDLGQIDIKAEITKSLNGNGAVHAAYVEGVTSRSTTQFQNVRLGKYAFDSGTVAVEAKNEWVRMSATDLKRATNTITLRAAYQMPMDFSKWADADYDFDFTVDAPDTAAFDAEPNLTGPHGQLEASGNVSHRNGLFDGKLNAKGAKLALPDFNAESLDAAVTIEKSMAAISGLSLVIDAKNRVNGSGKVDLHAPHDYSGKVDATLADLAVFNPILDAAGIHDRIGGVLTVGWEGSGNLSQIRHTGAVAIQLANGKYGIYQPISAEIAGKYSPETMDIPTFHMLVDKTDFRTQISMRNTEMKIHDVLLQQGTVKLLQGGMTLPLDLRTPTNPDTLIPTNGRVFINLASDDINLETLLIRPKQTTPLNGMVKVSINADGPLDGMIASILVRGRNLQSKMSPRVAPANLQLECNLKDNLFTLNGTLQQPAISPLLIAGKLPFSVMQFLKEKKLDDRTPVDLSVKLENSPVTIIGQLLPDVRYIEGRMGIDAKASGTIGKPLLSGAATLDMPAIRMKDPAAPAVNGFRGNMEFSGNSLTINRFGGEISGGPFNLAGKIVFEKLTEPVLDLRLSSKNALLIRNETLTVRADSDIKISGPYNKAVVTGNVGITKSRFFREVEILPIELPGRPAPKPPSEMQTGFSLKPPFSNWAFNVGIKTTDPFLIRGNLTNGSAFIDLKLMGMGYAPALEGTVRTEKFVASLPFSRLNIEHGFLYFSAKDPFVPTLDIQGASSLRDYNIRVYISGTPSDPVTVFTSDPPLPQEEIVALLGTGATTEELSGKGDVLAGRAAVLVIQKLYRKIFKEKPQETNSFLTRFELDPGAVDARTGRQEVSARFKVNDQYYLIGNIDPQGDVRGEVRYLLRFR